MQGGPAQLAQRFGRQAPPAVGSAVQETLAEQGAFEFGEGAGIDGGLLAELAGQHVQVDIVHGGARMALRELLGQLLQFGDVGKGLGTVPHAQRVVAAEALGAGPVLSRPGGLQVRVEPAQCVQQRR